MASELQAAIEIIVVLVIVTAFGWQAREVWDDVRRKDNV